MLSRNGFRITVLLLAVASLGVTMANSSSNATATELQKQSELPPEERTQLAEPRDNITVVTSFAGPLYAYAPNGTLLYHNDTYHSYWDVDPVPGSDRSVMYSATEKLNQSRCGADTRCVRNIVERLNLSTGHVERLHTRTRSGDINNEWHDVDMINETHLLVGDIRRNRVYIVNTETQLIEWEWEAQSDFEIGKGGSTAFETSYPNDWTHLNDVELLEDGRIMVSLRNQDQVVFVDRREGLQQNWTLGSDDEYDIMYEQHNPDYIPAERGGPAVVLADSQNNRIVEYQRTANGTWEHAWTWSDESMLWPRDSDRLPNGNTLITDTHSQRILEVGSQGEIVWRLQVPQSHRPYEAERLGTGDESAGGPSATRANLTSQGDADAVGEGPARTRDPPMSMQIWLTIKGAIPNKVLNAIMFVKPGWLTAGDIPSLLVFGTTVGVWMIAELRWTDISIQMRSPIQIRRE